ncbi:MAG TPA: hypothetical protein VF042_06785 [Gemmatimonadaceae bacterium]
MRIGSIAVAFLALTAACRTERARPADTVAAATNPPAVTTDPPKPDGYIIDAKGIGPVKLGMALGEVRNSLPSARIERTSDGEGVALVEITIEPGSSVIAYAGEDNPEAGIDWTKSISMLETFSERFHTTEGVHPASTIPEAEKAYGKTRSRETSEIESREYITFEKQPSGLTFRISPDGTVLSISISSR